MTWCCSQVEAVEAVLEQERKAGNAKDARHKLTVERLRQKLVELQVKAQHVHVRLCCCCAISSYLRVSLMGRVLATTSPLPVLIVCSPGQLA